MVLSSDASPYGVGAILLYIMDANTERLVVFTSQMLSKAETNHVYLERKILS